MFHTQEGDKARLFNDCIGRFATPSHRTQKKDLLYSIKQVTNLLKSIAENDERVEEKKLSLNKIIDNKRKELAIIQTKINEQDTLRPKWNCVYCEHQMILSVAQKHAWDTYNHCPNCDKDMRLRFRDAGVHDYRIFRINHLVLNKSAPN